MIPRAKRVYNLDNWGVIAICNSDPHYTSPEAIKHCLYGHRNGGKYVVTSSIVAANGRIVNTFSGSIYILENADPSYLNWLSANGYVLDQKQPVKVAD
jgi:hypothetical protein